MKKNIFILILSCISLLSYSTPTVEPNSNFEKTVKLVIDALAKKDSISLNRFINKDFGLAVIYRIGVHDIYSFNADILNTPLISAYYQITDNSNRDYTINYCSSDSIKYNCDTESWSKLGVFCNKKVKKRLSEIAEFNKEWLGLEITEKQIEAFENLESKSRRIVVCNDADDNLVFYLTLIDNRWYLTIFDVAIADCSV